MRVSEMLTGVRGDLAIKVFGADQAELGRLAEQISALVGEIDGAQDVYTPRNEGAQYYRIELDRMALGRLGLSVDAVAEAMRSMVEGSQAGVVYQGARRIPIVLRGPEAIRESAALFAGMEVTVPSGEVVPLASLARIDRVEGPVAIQREKGNRMAVVIANVTGRDLVGFVDEAREAVARGVNLPVGYFLEWGGQFENQQRAAKRLGLVVPVAIGLIFLILFSTFRSVSQAVLILANVPFAMIGGIAALWLTREYLSVPASVGFIALLGIAVLNGVVMVSYFNQLRAMGRPIAEVVVEGAKRRLRPVMMTATIAAFGLVPLLFATGPGSEIQKPLAIVVIGGLISSTALTLVLLPILYRRFLGGRPN
jgi:cobalt-zinc-cadmium resistance protein CzcA